MPFHAVFAQMSPEEAAQRLADGERAAEEAAAYATRYYDSVDDLRDLQCSAGGR